ncbi:MAG: Fic family protein [Patescibacteria group bacterium]
MAISDYKWQILPQVEEWLSKIDILKEVFSVLPVLADTAELIFEKSITNSAVSSAQIEDIPATEHSPGTEGENLINAYKFIYIQSVLPKLNTEVIKRLHKFVLQDISGYAGEYRHEPWAIFNSGGQVIHQTPLHILVPELMEELVTYINQLSEHPVIVAAIAQFIFEKIHPFADGNGRTGRLISSYLLHFYGYGLRGFVPIENYINKNRDWYYQALYPSHTISEFIHFYTTSLLSQSTLALQNFKNPPQIISGPNLSPRRREVLALLKDHPESSFDFIRRRFMQVSPESLHRDLQFLQDKKLIRKLGATYGVVYSAT